MKKKRFEFLSLSGCALALGIVVCLLTGASAANSTQSAQGSQEQSPATPPVLKNKDVLEMLKAGIPAKAIVARIKASACDFDKSAKALDKLKSADAPYAVISAMMHAPGPDAEPEKETPAAQPAPTATPPPAVVQPALAVPPPLPKPKVASPPPDGAVEVTIPDSTPFVVELAEDLTSDKIKTNYVVFFNVAEDVKINGITIIAKGARARARVIDAKKARSWGRSARIFMTMQDVRAVNGELLPVRAGNDLRGVDTNQQMKNAAIATGQIAWALAPVWGLKHGGSVGVPAGTKFEAYIYGTRKLSVKPEAPTPPTSN